MPPPRGEGMTDSPLWALSQSRGTGDGADTQTPHGTTPHPTQQASPPDKHAPPGVGVHDLRPLRGRPPARSWTPTPHQRAHKPAENPETKISTTQAPHLTGPASSGMTE